MAPIWPAIWSALAATAAAISTFLTFLIHRANRAESVRPELMFPKWNRIYVANVRDHLGIAFIENIGRGPAQSVIFTCESKSAAARPRSFSIIPPGHKEHAALEVDISWNEVSGDPLTKEMPVLLTLRYADSIGNQYETQYELLICEFEQGHAMPHFIRIDHGVGLLSRTTTRTDVLIIKAIAAYERIKRVLKGKLTKTKGAILVELPKT